MRKSSTWSTSSFGHAAHISPGEWSALGEHLQRCRAASGRMFTIQCGGEAVRRFLSARIVTTLLIAALLILGGMALFG